MRQMLSKIAFLKPPLIRFEVLLQNVAEPEDLRDWVAKNIRPLAYQGMLRDSRGTLADRQGNSLDRARLLAELMELAGYDVRLARASLTAKQVDVKQGRLEFIPPPILAADTTDQRLTIIDDLLASAPEQAQTDCAKAISDRIDSQTAALLEIIGELGDSSYTETVQKTALADHWWVQAKINGVWQDFDPDDLAAVAQETLLPEALPDSLVHRLAMSLKLEVSEQNQSRIAEILNVEGSASHWSDAPISIGFQAAKTSQMAVIDTQADLAHAFADTDEWVAVLRHADTVQFSQVFSKAGELREYQGGIDASPRNLSSTAGGLLGGLQTGRNDDKSSASTAQVTALWIDFSISRPGRDTQTVQRYLFDLRGSAARKNKAPFDELLTKQQEEQRTLALLSLHDLEISAGNSASLRLAARTAANLASAARSMDGFYSSDNTRPTPSVEQAEQLLRSLPRIPLQLNTLLASRDALAQSPHAVPIDQINIFRLRTMPSFSEPKFSLMIDIVNNDPAPSVDVTSTLRQGVTDTVLEQVVLGVPSDPSVNTSALFAADLINGIAWQAIRTQQELLDSSLPSDVKAIMSDAISAGDIVVAPTIKLGQRGDAISWWRINPESGVTLGISASGAGQGMTEMETLIARSVGFLICYAELRDAMAKANKNNTTLSNAEYWGGAACVTGIFFGGFTQLAKVQKISQLKKLGWSAGRITEGTKGIVFAQAMFDRLALIGAVFVLWHKW